MLGLIIALSFIIVILLLIIFLLLFSQDIPTLNKYFFKDKKLITPPQMPHLSEAITKEHYKLLENERERIAKDIHDEVISSINSAIMELQLAMRTAGQLSPVMEAATGKVVTIIDQATSNLRNIVFSLSHKSFSNNSDFNLDLKQLCMKFDGRNGTQVLFECNNFTFVLNEIQREHMFRILQELITNTFKHSPAWHIVVQMIWSYDNVELRYRDDGQFKNTEKANSYGMRSIYERGALANGTVEIKQNSKGGIDFKLIVYKITI